MTRLEGFIDLIRRKRSWIRLMKKYYLGIDVGSVITNLVLWMTRSLVYRDYLKTMGQPIKVVQEGLKIQRKEWGILV